ncbi:Beta-1,6-galactofuranosyltransferase WbbI [Lactococcus lactis]|nr:Beta-1,6-galactofuranosyltransferase WbbI [Lactococcus lactis]
MWKQAALASFIVENNLGFVVDNLEELPQKLSQISEQDYNEMVINVQKMGKKIRSGYFLSEALKKADKVLEENK